MVTAGAGAVGREPMLWIGGEPTSAQAGGYPVVNPATERVIGYAPEASAAEAQQAASAAAAAFPAWANTAPAERARLLSRAAELLEEHSAELSPLVQAETGALTAMATMQIPATAQRLRRYSRGALEPTDIPLPPAPNGAGGGLVNALATRLPVGVVACISAYNVPTTNVAGKIGPALAMGNTVVVKPAPQDPLAVIRLVELCHEAGFPPGVINLVVGSTPEPSRALVEAPEVDMVSFTGSTVVGKQINIAAAGSFTRVLLELGGKGASLVFDDADVDAATRGTASTFTFHAGQICTAPTRLIVQRGVYDKAVSRLGELAAASSVGDPTSPDTAVGPVISAAHRDRVESAIADGSAAGGTVIAGGSRPAIDCGFYVAPTLIADCDGAMTVAREEIFGPVVVAMPFDDEDEGIALANASDYGLYDYVWSADTVRAMRVAKHLRTGNVGINTVARNPETPFGGFRRSGIGRDGGSFGLRAYSELQSEVWPG